MNKSRHQSAALHYAKFTDPLDPDKGWQREDVQVAFMAGMNAVGISPLLTLPEVARILAVSVSVVRDLVRFGELSYVHAGRGTERKHLTFSVNEIASFIKRHTTRDYHNPAPKTARITQRKSARELALERATEGSSGWVERARAEMKAKK